LRMFLITTLLWRLTSAFICETGEVNEIVVSYARFTSLVSIFVFTVLLLLLRFCRPVSKVIWSKSTSISYLTWAPIHHFSVCICRARLSKSNPLLKVLATVSAHRILSEFYRFIECWELSRTVKVC